MPDVKSPTIDPSVFANQDSMAIQNLPVCPEVANLTLNVRRHMLVVAVNVPQSVVLKACLVVAMQTVLASLTSPSVLALSDWMETLM